VGKTYLIDRYFNRRFAFKITGYEKQPKDIQLQNFANELSRQTRTEQKVPENWMKAFEMLRSYLEALPSDEKAVVKAVVETVSLVNGRLSVNPLFDELFKSYFSE
jgi:hypothetical protein